MWQLVDFCAFDLVAIAAHNDRFLSKMMRPKRVRKDVYLILHKYLSALKIQPNRAR